MFPDSVTEHEICHDDGIDIYNELEMDSDGERAVANNEK